MHSDPCFGYAFLKLSGKGEGLDAVSRELGKRFEANGVRGDAAPVEPGTA